MCLKEKVVSKGVFQCWGMSPPVLLTYLVNYISISVKEVINVMETSSVFFKFIT